MPVSSDTRRAQARHAAAIRWQKPDQDDAARDYAATRIADYVQRIVAEAPPLTVEQRERIARLLTPAGGGRIA